MSINQTDLSNYRPDQPFTCFDKSKTYSFEHVNDDYCDCPDGSDEPGTSACPNGKFYCANVGYRPKYISSMFVDDGVCDCCDGSDEKPLPGGHVKCPNTCDELGKIVRQQIEEKRAAMENGHQVHKEYVKTYAESIQQKKDRLKELEIEHKASEDEKNRLQQAKEEIEKQEKEAKDLHHQQWEEEKKRLQDEREKQKALEAFSDLDTDKNGVVSMAEIQAHLEFDVNGDGQVSDDEAREHLEDNLEADQNLFVEKVWPHIKDLYRKPGSEPQEFHEETTTETQGEPVAIGEEEEDEDEEPKIDDFTPPPGSNFQTPHQNEEEDFKMPEYPEETKKLMEAADQARNAYEEARRQWDDLDREYSDLLAVTGSDFGVNGEYYPLRGECFEMEDREYIYKLCPFDKATQKQKHGHHETNLGRFEKWSGPADDNYSSQSYTNGEGCWNGPARSCHVKIRCGSENKITSVSEPNRCEYAMDFSTPAACNVEPPPIDHHSYWHEDL